MQKPSLTKIVQFLPLSQQLKNPLTIMKKKTHESYSFNLPVEMLAWLKKEAHAECRTMAGHLEFILRKVKEGENLDSR